MLEKYPYKKCKFNGCDFRGSDAEPVKKHEDECESRYAPCGNCDAEISLRGLAQHVVNKHCRGVEIKVDSFGIARRYFTPSSDLKKSQFVISVKGDDCQKFLFNRCSSDGDVKMFWVAYIGKKVLSSNYKYTLQVQRSKEETKQYVFEGTRDCIPCDMSHKDVKARRWALMLDKDLIADAVENDRLYYWLTIDKV